MCCHISHCLLSDYAVSCVSLTSNWLSSHFCSHYDQHTADINFCFHRTSNSPNKHSCYFCKCIVVSPNTSSNNKSFVLFVFRTRDPADWWTASQIILHQILPNTSSDKKCSVLLVCRARHPAACGAAPENLLGHAGQDVSGAAAAVAEQSREWISPLTHSCPPFKHLLSERLTSLGQQMFERWAWMG